jgi:hypothetical protein
MVVRKWLGDGLGWLGGYSEVARWWFRVAQWCSRVA